MRTSLRWLLIVLLVFSASCAKKYEAENKDMTPNLDPELADPNFLKIKRPRPLTKEEKEALASKTDIPFNLDVRDTEQVQLFLTYFTQERRDTMERWLERAAPHLPYIRAVLATQKLPPDIIALPFIESGYNTMAYSPAGAGGMWQFMPATGRRFGLNIDWWEDERRNPYLATVAAAKYLSELYNMFGDWNLALAAYNCGEGKMSRVISQSGHNDFFDIAKNPKLLKEETRNYVPKFLAVLKIFKNLDALGFKKVNWGAGQVLEEVPVPGGTDLAAMAEFCSLNWEEFHKYNPGFRRQVSPPDRQSQVYVPVAKKEMALAYLQNPSCVAARGIKSYTTAQSDTWWTLSRRTGVPIAALRQMNPSAGEQLIPGQALYFPLDGSEQDTALANLDEKPASTKGAVVLASSQSHKVKRGESLAAISKRYGVSSGDILKANNIKSSKHLVAGTTLTIPVKAGASCPPVQPKYVAGSTNTIEVKKGLTLSAVAAANQVDVETLMAMNGLKSPKDLRAGMKLKVPGEAKHAQTPAQVAMTPPPKEAPEKNQAQAKRLAQVAAGQSGKDQQAKAAPAGKQPEPKQEAKAAKTPEPKAQVQTQASGGKKPSGPVNYKVASGETVWSIARKFNVNPIALLNWNKLDRAVQLKPGDKLTINVD